MAKQRQRKHRRKNYRSGRFMGLYAALTALLVAAVIVAGSVVFFHVSQVEIYVRDSVGNTTSLGAGAHYTEEDVLNAAGISLGDNLALLNKSRASNGILETLPYVSSVTIRKVLPDTLRITISQSAAAAAIQTEEEVWWLIDMNGKLLEETDTSKDSTVLTGLTLVKPQVGEVLEVPDGSDEKTDSQQLQKDSLLQLLPSLVNYGLNDKVKSIDFSSDSELVLDYDGRLQVKMPLECDFDYKVKYFAKILNDYVAENWSEKDTGVLDMTYEDGHPHLIKGSGE